MLKNPLIIGIVLGVLSAVFKISTPIPFSSAIDMLSIATAPVALVFIGGTLAGLKWERAAR